MRTKTECRESGAGLQLTCEHALELRTLRHRDNSNAEGLQAKRCAGIACMPAGSSKVCCDTELGHTVLECANGRARHGTDCRSNADFSCYKTVPLSSSHDVQAGQVP